MTVDNNPDPAAVAAVRARLSELAGRSELRGSKIGQANPSTLALAVPHDIFTLGVDKLAAAVPIEEARQVAQGFLVLDGTAPIACAEVTLTRGSVTYSEGRLVEALRRAVQMVDGDIVGVTAQVRVLRLPEIHVVALWLHQVDGQDDVLVPLAPTPRGIEAYRRYRPDQLSEVLAVVAQRHLDPPSHSGG